MYVQYIFINNERIDEGEGDVEFSAKVKASLEPCKLRFFLTLISQAEYFMLPAPRYGYLCLFTFINALPFFPVRI